MVQQAASAASALAGQAGQLQTVVGEFNLEPQADIVVIAGQDLTLQQGPGSPGASP